MSGAGHADEGCAIKSLFLDRSFTGTRFCVLALLALLLMVADHRWAGSEPLRSALVTMVAPLHGLTHWPFAAAWHVAEIYDVHAENKALREQLLTLAAEAQRARALQADNAELRSLLAATDGRTESMLLADVISLGTDPRRRALVIGRGDADGVSPGQATVDAYGLVGQVVDVGRQASRVLLITDRSQVTPVMVVRNDYRAMLHGVGERDQLELRHVPHTADVQVGDLLVTSGLDQRFPAGYPVATVADVQRLPGEPFLQIIAEPTARLERSRQLVVLEPILPLPEPEGAGP